MKVLHELDKFPQLRDIDGDLQFVRELLKLKWSRSCCIDRSLQQKSENLYHCTSPLVSIAAVILTLMIENSIDQNFRLQLETTSPLDLSIL
jgi:hypothetical protein